MRWLLLVCLLCGLAHADKPRSATGYRNGKPIRIRVVDVNGADVEVKTARAFEKMRAAAAKSNVKLFIWSGFRTHQRQAELYKQYRRKEGNLAARPGFSNHQSGRALDLVVDSDKTYDWLRENAHRFGFQRTVRGEPWHWEYAGRPIKLRKKPKPRRTSS